MHLTNENFQTSTSVAANFSFMFPQLPRYIPLFVLVLLLESLSNDREFFSLCFQRFLWRKLLTSVFPVGARNKLAAGEIHAREKWDRRQSLEVWSSSWMNLPEVCMRPGIALWSSGCSRAIKTLVRWPFKSFYPGEVNSSIQVGLSTAWASPEDWVWNMHQGVLFALSCRHHREAF